MISKSGLLMIEPSAKTSSSPIIDELTLKMTAALRASTEGTRWRGVHTCRCGVYSDNADHWVTDAQQTKLLTNSLAVHYLAFHRDDVPAAELDKVRSLPFAGVAPTERELSRPEAGDEGVARRRQALR